MVTDPGRSDYVGACELTSRAAELTAIVWALLWVIANWEAVPCEQVTIHFDRPLQDLQRMETGVLAWMTLHSKRGILPKQLKLRLSLAHGDFPGPMSLRTVASPGMSLRILQIASGCSSLSGSSGHAWIRQLCLEPLILRDFTCFLHAQILWHSLHSRAV